LDPAEVISKVTGVDRGRQGIHLWIYGVGQVAIEASLTIANANPRSKDESSTFLEHGRRVDGCHRVRHGIVSDQPHGGH